MDHNRQDTSKIKEDWKSDLEVKIKIEQEAREVEEKEHKDQEECGSKKESFLPWINLEKDAGEEEHQDHSQQQENEQEGDYDEAELAPSEAIVWSDEEEHQIWKKLSFVEKLDHVKVC